MCVCVCVCVCVGAPVCRLTSLFQIGWQLTLIMHTTCSLKKARGSKKRTHL